MYALERLRRYERESGVGRLILDGVFDLMQLLGGVILSSGYIPQIAQVIKTKSVKDLNPQFLWMVFTGVCFMEGNALYMVLEKHAGLSFLLTNTLSLALCGTMVSLYQLYKGDGK